MSDRIKLAEAMGWTEIIDRNNGEWRNMHGTLVKGLWGISPDGIGPQRLPDPFTGANDCEALIRWLAREHGVLFTIWYLEAEDQTVVDCSRDRYVFDRLKWRGDDWKQGVCELALRVIE